MSITRDNLEKPLYTSLGHFAWNIVTHNIASMDIQYKLEMFRTYSPAVAWSGLIKEVANSSK